MSRRLAYAVVHRHGHRTPSSNLRGSAADADFWRSYLPTDEESREISEPFRVVSDQRNGVPSDLKGQPFGLLTRLGLMHMTSVGDQLANAFPDLKRVSDVYTRSTNYNRTQMSAQALMHGMGIRGGDVHVKAAVECPMSMYDSNPDISKDIFQRVQQRDDFAMTMKGVEHIKERMIRVIPELGNHRSGFDWFAAFDYYTCRRGHGIDFSDELREYEEGVVQHVVDRYHKYNTDPEHYVNFATPLLKAVLQSLKGSVSGGSESGPSLSIFSCHDTNIISMLYAIKRLGSFTGAKNGINSNCRENSHPIDVISWPGFGSSIVFELLESSATDRVVKIYYNMNPLQYLYKDLSSAPHTVDHIVSNKFAYVLPSALSSATVAAGTDDRLSDNISPNFYRIKDDEIYRDGISLQKFDEYVQLLMDSAHMRFAFRVNNGRS